MDYKAYASEVSNAVLDALAERKRRKDAASKAAAPMTQELGKLVRALSAALPATKQMGKITGQSEVLDDGTVQYQIRVINSDHAPLEIRVLFDADQSPALSMISQSGEEFGYDDLDKLVEMAGEDIKRFLTTL